MMAAATGDNPRSTPWWFQASGRASPATLWKTSHGASNSGKPASPQSHSRLTCKATSHPPTDHQERGPACAGPLSCQRTTGRATRSSPGYQSQGGTKRTEGKPNVATPDNAEADTSPTSNTRPNAHAPRRHRPRRGQNQRRRPHARRRPAARVPAHQPPHPLLRPRLQRRLRPGHAAVATSVAEPADQFYGDRLARITDPHGNQWSISTHIEDLTTDQIPHRLAAIGEG